MSGIRRTVRVDIKCMARRQRTSLRRKLIEQVL